MFPPKVYQSLNNVLVFGDNTFDIVLGDSDDFLVCDVDLYVDISLTGSYIEEQDIDLELSQNVMGMTSSSIMDGACGTDDALKVTFDDDAANGVNSVCGDVSGNAVAHPDTPLSAFNMYQSKV